MTKKASEQIELKEIIKRDITYLVFNKIITSLEDSKIKKESRRLISSRIEKAVVDKDWKKCLKYILYYQKFEPAYIPYENSKKSEYQILLENMAPAYYVRHETFFISEYINCLNELYELGFIVEGGPLIVYNADGKEEALSVAEKASSLLKKYFYPLASDYYKGNLDESIYIYRFTDKEGMFWKADRFEVLNLEQLRLQPEALE